MFEQDDADDRAAVDQARRLLQQANSQLANLRSAAKPTEIAQAEANLRDAEAVRDRVQEDLRRNEALLKSGSATRQIVDQEDADLRSAEAKVAAATAALATADAPMGRPGEIEAQSSMVDSLDAALKQAEWRLAQRVSRLAGERRRCGCDRAAGRDLGCRRAGGLAIAGSRTSSCASSFPRPNSSVFMSATPCSSNATIAPAISSGRSPTSRHRPSTRLPFIYSEQTRTKFVFIAEARPPPAQATILNPGQPVTVIPQTNAP